jgi:hypothetical protein
MYARSFQNPSYSDGLIRTGSVVESSCWRLVVAGFSEEQGSAKVEFHLPLIP